MVGAGHRSARREDLGCVADGRLVELGAPERPVHLAAGHYPHGVPDGAGRRAVHLDRLGLHRAERDRPLRLRIVAVDVAGRVLPRPAAEQLDHVGQHRQQGPEALADALRAAGEVHDQGCAARAGHRPRQGGHRRLPKALAPHQLGEAGRLAFEHRAGGLGGHVPRAEPGPAGGDHERESSRIRQLAQAGLDRGAIVGHHGPSLDVEPRLAQQGLGGVARAVGSRSLGDAVGDRHDGGADAAHGPILPDAPALVRTTVAANRHCGHEPRTTTTARAPGGSRREHRWTRGSTDWRRRSGRNP